MPKDSLLKHLRHWHKGTKGHRKTAASFDGLPVGATIRQLEPCPDGSPSLSFLLPPVSGFCCLECPNFKTISEHAYRKHVRREHGVSDHVSSKKQGACFLQRWTVGTGRSHTEYWKVDISSAARDYCGTGEHEAVVERQQETDPAERTLADVEADEEARICEEAEQGIAFDQELETDENSDWLRGCGWPRWFRQKPIPLLLAAASIPVAGCPRDLFLGRWNGVDCVSPAAAERSLQLLVVASHRVLARCQETLGSTPRVLRCWVRSWTHSFSPYPFDLPSAPTVRKYSHTWISGVCYFMRLHLLARRLCETTLHLCGFALTNAQKSAIDGV